MFLLIWLIWIVWLMVGEHRRIVEEGLGEEEIKAIKGMDLQGVRGEVRRQRKILNRLKGSHTARLAGGNTHVVFEEEEEEEDEDRKRRKKRRKKKKKDVTERAIEKEGRKAMREIKAREDRLERLEEVERRKGMEKRLMNSKGSMRKVDLVVSQKNSSKYTTKPYIKYKRQRNK